MLALLPVGALAQDGATGTRHGSWAMRCAPVQGAPAAVTVCSLSQVVAADPAGQRVVLGVTVDLLESPTVPTIRFRLGTATRREAGIGLRIDDGPELRLAIGQCDARRCEAAGRLAPDVLQRLESGRVAQVAFLAGTEARQLTVPVALDGFRDGLAALRAAQAGR